MAFCNFIGTQSIRPMGLIGNSLPAVPNISITELIDKKNKKLPEVTTDTKESTTTINNSNDNDATTDQEIPISLCSNHRVQVRDQYECRNISVQSEPPMTDEVRELILSTMYVSN